MASPDEVPLFERCGNTDFWKPKNQTNEDLEVTFVDPVSIVVIQSNLQPDNQLLVMRGWFEESYDGFMMDIHQALPPEESIPLIIWLRAIMEALPKVGKGPIIRKFASLHPDAQKTLISAIIHWLTRLFQNGWKGDQRTIPANLDRLWELLNSAGISEC